MGKIKYIKARELFEKSLVVSFSSIQRIVKNKQYTKQLIKNLLDQGKIKRLTKGHYTIYNDPSLVVFCFKPAYLGLQDAMSFNNLWEQETIPVVLTTKRVRSGKREILDTNVLIRRINKKYMFGFEYKKQGDIYLPYSDIEKTFIDMLYFKEKISEKEKESFVKKINRKRLNSYLKKYPKKFRNRVLKDFCKV